jgi:hypothetical protein
MLCQVQGDRQLACLSQNLLTISRYRFAQT